MRPRTFVPLLLGLGVGVVAIRMGRDMLARASGSQGEQVGVVISGQEIDSAALIPLQALKQRHVPASLVPPGAFTDPKKLTTRVTATMVPAGVMITESMLAPPGTQPGLSSRIPDGYRAVAVKVDEASSVGGFITPGSHVDVSAVLTQRLNGKELTSSRIILQNVRVGAVGQSLNSTGPDGKSVQLSRSVTLLVRPEDVPKLQMAASKGYVHLALRNGRGETPDAMGDAAKRFGSLFSSLKKRRPEPKPQPPPVVAQAAPRQHVVEVYRGSQMERVVFNGPAGSVMERVPEPGSAPPASEGPATPKPSAPEVGE